MPQPAADRPLRVAVIGAGPRSVVYARQAMERPSAMKIVAVAEPDERRRRAIAEHHGIPAEHCFSSSEDLATHPGLAEAAINTTLDIVHYSSTLALLRAGYHVLLEKPIAPTEAEVHDLIRVAREHDRIIMVCHILRYEPFFQTIKQHLDARSIGRLISIHTVENVSYDHVATTYIRHPRNLQPTVFPMLLTKCCHDLDVIAWLTGNAQPARVASMITPSQFRPEHAPANSTARCLDGCAVESTCRYSARALHVEDDKWDAYAWPINEYAKAPSDAEKLQILKTTSPYGRCVWRSPNHVVDHQSVIVQFEGGTTASHDLICATSRPGRTIRIVGTEGEIEGNYDAGHIVLRRALRGVTGLYAEEHAHVPPHTVKGPRQCERALVEDFVGTVRGDVRSPGLTRIEDSLIGHQIAFAAEVAAREHRVVEIRNNHCNGNGRFSAKSATLSRVS